MTRSGFSLFEFLLYLTLIIFVSMITIDCMTRAYTQIVSYARRCDSAIGLCAALDLLERDIQIYFSDESRWLRNGTNHYKWSGAHDIEWRVKDGMLIRSEGRIQGVVAHKVSELRLEQKQKEGRRLSLFCRLAAQHPDCCVERVVTIRNGAL